MLNRILIINLTLEEGNLILEALAERPFKLVFELIGKLNQQANNLFDKASDYSTSQEFSFSEQEMSLTIKALGGMPYNRVHGLLVSLNKQIKDQLNCQPSGKASTAYADI